MKAVQSTLPTVALVGRANVGKSTLFNRLCERHRALISSEAGTTRDRKVAPVLWRGKTFNLMDTGGLEFDETDDIERQMAKQTEAAISEADVIVFVTDVRDGVLQQDTQIADMLQNIDAPVLLAANKVESDNHRNTLHEKAWYNLGLGEARAVSAIRGTGLGDLLDEIFEHLEQRGKPPVATESTEAPRIAFIGKPNVGKSSIVNAILGEERFVTSPIAHTTREPNDTLVQFDEKQYIIIDTAGIRRKTRVAKGIEAGGVRMSLSTLDYADVAVLVFDATQPIDAQEKQLAGLIAKSQTSCIIALNKWDLIEDKTTTSINEFEKTVRAQIPHLDYAPILTISAKERQRIHKLFPLFDTIMKERQRRIDDNALERFLRVVMAKHKPARGKGVAHPKILDFTQVSVDPPRFHLTIKGQRTDVLHPSYLRFLENRLRETFHFTGTPIHIRSIPSKRR